MTLERGVSDAKKGPEKQGESFFSKFNFGQFLGDAEKAKKDPELAERVKSRKNKKVVQRKSGEKPTNGDKDETPEETELKKMADNLAHTAKKIEVKTDADDKNKNTVKIDLDLAKFKDLAKAELTEVLTPDVKSCSLKIYETNTKGEREVKEEKVVFRGIEDGKVNYFFKDKEGRNVSVSLPLTGGAELTINPDQLENKSRPEVLALMKKELVETSQKALSKSMDAAADSLFEVPASGGGSGGVRTPGASPSVNAGPSYSPSASPSVDVGGYKPAETVRNTVINAAGNYEAVKGDLDNVTEEVAAKESPTGRPLLMNYSRNPELKQREPHYIMCLHGDYGNAKSFMNETLQDADKLRRSGINAVIVSLEYAGVKDQMNSSWNFLKGKVDGLFGYCFEKFGKGKFDLVAFSGGYRAVETILKETKDLAQINTISMLDSTYDWKGINDALENYVKAGGNVMAFTATERPNQGAKKIDKFLQKAAKSGEVKGSFKHLHKSGSHGSAAFMGEALAFAGGVENRDLMADRALANLLLKTSKSPILDRYRVKGQCEQYSDVLRAQAVKIISGGKLKLNYSINFNSPLNFEATRRLRAKSISQFTKDDLSNLPAGTVFFVNDPDKYGEKIVPNTDNILPKIADRRHWFTYIGQSQAGEPIFADNHGDGIGLDKMKVTCGNRVVLNVYDPYAEIRSALTVDSNGQLALSESNSREVASL